MVRTDYANLTNINSSNNRYGIYVYVYSYNNIFTNIITNNNERGLSFVVGINNIITNLTSNSNDYGIYLTSVSDRNSFIDIKSTGNSIYGLSVVNSDNNKFTDATFSGATDDVYLSSTALNITLLNASYDISKEAVSAGSELIREWYYRAYANDTEGNDLDGVNVSALSSDTYLDYLGDFNLTTDSNGLTEIYEIIDYINNGTDIIYYSNYTISANKTGYIGDGHYYNVSADRNDLRDVFTLNSKTNIIACTVLNQANTIYTQTANIEDDTLTGPCINITAENITLDCGGRYIKSDDNFAGIYSDQFNTTIKNCNVSMSTFSGGYGIYLYGADDSYIFNNTLNEQRYGLYLRLTSNTRVENNTANDNSYYGIYLSNGFNNIIRYSNLSDNSYYDFYVSASTVLWCSNTLENVTGSGGRIIGYYNYSVNLENKEYSELILCNADNSRLDNITISGSDTENNNMLYVYRTSFSNLTNINSSGNEYGIYFYSSSNNILMNSTLYSNIRGVYLAFSDNNLIMNNTADSNQYGMYIYYADKNNLTNNTINSNSRYGYYIFQADYNTLTNNNIWDCQSSSYACVYLYESSYNVFDMNKIKDSSNYGIRLYSFGVGDGSSHNVFKNTNMTNIDDISVVLDDNAGGQNLNNTFLNFTYNDESVDVNSTLIRKWYYRAYANDTDGNDLAGVDVSAYNVSDDWQYSILTNLSGWSNITEIIEYVNYGGTRSYYSNYTINATKLGYSRDWHYYNVSATKNNLKDVFTLNSETNIIACRVLDQANTVYTQTANIENNGLTGPCINITAQNVTLDCDGYYIKSTSNVAGIYSNQINSTIKNCNISMGGAAGYGIYLDRANYSYVFGNILNDQYAGLELWFVDNTTIENNTVNLNYRGMEIIYSANNTIVDNTVYSSDTWGIRIYGNNNVLVDNNIWDCTSNIYGCLYFSGSASNNIISGGIINKSDSHLILLRDGSKNNIFRDIQLYDSTEAAVNVTIYSENNVFDNLTIVSDSDVAGIYSNQINTTIMNSNISMGAGWDGRGIYLDGANNSYVYDNILNEQGFGVRLEYTTNTRIEDNIANKNTVTGISINAESNNNVIINNTANSNQYGVYLFTSDNNTLVDNTANLNWLYGIAITSSSSNNNLTDNMVNSNRFAFVLTGSSNNNILTNNNIWNCTASSASDSCMYISNADNNTISGGIINLSENYLIHLLGSENNLFANIQLYNSTNHAVNVSNSENNVFDNLTILSESNKAGIYSDSVNTTIMNSNISMGSAGGYGIHIDGADESNIYNNLLNGQQRGIYLYQSSFNLVANTTVDSNTQYGIYIDWGDHNLIKDSSFTNSGSLDLNINSASINNTFLNVTYSIADEYVCLFSCELIRKWYYQANVSDENGNAIEAANISAYNVSDDWQFSLMTKSNGLTNITEIIDYINNGGTRGYYSNYTINTTNGTINESHQLNVSAEVVNGIILDQIVIQAKSVAATLSINLSSGIYFNISSLPAVNASATGNRGLVETLYNITIDATGTTADLYVKGDTNLTEEGGLYKILLFNEKVSYNISDPTVPSGNKSSLTANFSNNPIGTNLGDGTVVYLKFFLNVSGQQEAGIYKNNLTFKVVSYGSIP